MKEAYPLRMVWKIFNRLAMLPSGFFWTGHWPIKLSSPFQNDYQHVTTLKSYNVLHTKRHLMDDIILTHLQRQVFVSLDGGILMIMRFDKHLGLFSEVGFFKRQPCLTWDVRRSNFVTKKSAFIRIRIS